MGVLPLKYICTKRHTAENIPSKHNHKAYIIMLSRTILNRIKQYVQYVNYA